MSDRFLVPTTVHASTISRLPLPLNLRNRRPRRRLHRRVQHQEAEAFPWAQLRGLSSAGCFSWLLLSLLGCSSSGNIAKGEHLHHLSGSPTQSIQILT